MVWSHLFSACIWECVCPIDWFHHWRMLRQPSNIPSTPSIFNSEYWTIWLYCPNSVRCVLTCFLLASGNVQVPLFGFSLEGCCDDHQTFPLHYLMNIVSTELLGCAFRSVCGVVSFISRQGISPMEWILHWGMLRQPSNIHSTLSDAFSESRTTGLCFLKGLGCVLIFLFATLWRSRDWFCHHCRVLGWTSNILYIISEVYSKSRTLWLAFLNSMECVLTCLLAVCKTV